MSREQTRPDRRQVIQTLASAGILGLAGCSGNPGGGEGGTTTPTPEGETQKTTETKQPSGGTVKIASVDDPGSLSILSPSMDWFQQIVAFPMYSGLLRESPDLPKLQPDLASELPTVSDDGKTWKFTLREGATWHDGSKLTAEDVKYHYEWIIGQEYQVFLNQGYGFIENISTDGELGITFELNEPFAAARASLFTQQIGKILPKKVLDGIKSPAKWSPKTKADFVGGGPFKFEEWKPGRLVRLKAHDGHPRGRPNVDELKYEFFSGQSTATQSLNSGDVDVLARGVAPSQVKDIQSNDKFNTQATKAINYFFISWQLDPEALRRQDIDPETTLLRNKKFRQAMAYAAPRKKFVSQLLNGFGFIPYSPVPQSLDFWHNPETNGLYGDGAELEKARSLLDEIGATDDDGDGIRENPDTGEPLKFSFLGPSQDPQRKQAMKMYRDTVKKIGVDLELNVVEFGKLMELAWSSHNYELMIGAWQGHVDPDYLFKHFADQTFGFGDKAGINTHGRASKINPDLQKLLEKQRVQTSRKARQKTVYEIQKVFMEEVIEVPIWSGITLWATGKATTNWDANATDGMMNLTSLQQMRQG